MKYFSNGIAESLPWAKRLAVERRRWNAYERHLKKLKEMHRISTPAFEFFAHGFGDDSLHDGRLLSFSAGDGLNYVPDGTTPFLRRPSRPRSAAEIRILNRQENALYTFRYQDLRRIDLEKPPHPHWVNADDFDHLLDYELTGADRRYLRHEYKFDSDASIIIEFRRLVFRRHPIRRQYPIVS